MKGFTHALLLSLTSLGYIGIALGLMVEIIPSEIVLAYGGYLVSQGKISFWGTVIAGVIGGTIAQWFIYWIGYFGGRPFLSKYGKYLLIREKHSNIAEAWFAKYGAGVIFSARFIPVVRHAISVPAGISKMPFKKFTVYTMLAVIPWSCFFIYLGSKLGDNWGKINETAKPYVQPTIVIAIVVMAVYLLFIVFKKKKRGVSH
jgi:membrane protein DedA with SNARE-associated domain